MSSTCVFDRSRADAEIFRAHLDYEMRGERDPYLAEPEDVAAAAERLARRHLKHLEGRPMQPVSFVAYAARCVYAMSHYGWSWLDVSRIATKGVADLVAAASPDLRRPFKSQCLEHVSWLSRIVDGDRLETDEEKFLHRVADELQIIRMAELYASTRRLADDRYLPRERAREEQEQIVIWQRQQAAYLELLRGRLFADPRHAKLVAAVDERLVKISAKARRPHARDLARLAGPRLVGAGPARMLFPAGLVPDGWYGDAGASPDASRDNDDDGDPRARCGVVADMYLTATA